jgi:hypothetical protein
MRVQLKLRLFYGKPMYDAGGNIVTRSEGISLEYKTLEYINFMKHLLPNGISSVKVEKAFNLDKVNKEVSVNSEDRYEVLEDLSVFQANVDEYLKLPEKELTPEQKEIKELQEQLKALKQSQTGTKDDKPGLAISKAKKPVEAQTGTKDVE